MTSILLAFQLLVCPVTNGDAVDCYAVPAEALVEAMANVEETLPSERNVDNEPAADGSLSLLNSTPVLNPADLTVRVNDAASWPDDVDLEFDEADVIVCPEPDGPAVGCQLLNVQDLAIILRQLDEDTGAPPADQTRFNPSTWIEAYVGLNGQPPLLAMNPLDGSTVAVRLDGDGILTTFAETPLAQSRLVACADGELAGVNCRLASVSDLAMLIQELSSPSEQPAPEPEPDPKPAEPAVAKTTQMLTSWYGPGFAGNRTANGESFDPAALTAAHRELPFGTRLRVTNPRNGASVVVRINDRGPFAGGRQLDLSQAAAETIGMRGSGVMTLQVEILE